MKIRDREKAGKFASTKKKPETLKHSCMDWFHNANDKQKKLSVQSLFQRRWGEVSPIRLHLRDRLKSLKKKGGKHCVLGGTSLLSKFWTSPTHPTLERKCVRFRNSQVVFLVFVCLVLSLFCCHDKKTKNAKPKLHEEIKSSFFSRNSQHISNSTLNTHTHTTPRGE